MKGLPLLSLTALVVAEKDSNYYPPGYSNPNVNRKMYWKEGHNVIEDLDQFDKLYVEFHSCAWSPFREGEYDWMCGYQGGDDWDGSEYWYLGLTQCFRANVGFSLYGILTGEEDVGCEKSTFINSFLTTRGAATFVEALQYEGHISQYDFDFDTFNAHCNLEGGNYNDEGEEEDWYAHDPADYISYGLGCTGKKFAIQNFQGKYCSGRDIIETVDELEDINEEIKEAASCAMIYDRAEHGAYGDEEEYDYDEEEEYEYDEDGGGGSGDNNYYQIGSALGILRWSKACSTRLYPRECPDPYGLVSKYQQNLHGKTQGSNDYRIISAVRKSLGTIMLIVGLALFVYAYYIYGSIKKKTVKKDLDSEEEEGSLPLVKQISSRVASNISKASESVVSAIQVYAEEEVTDGEDENDPSPAEDEPNLASAGNEETADDFEVVNAPDGGEEANNKEVADAMLAEKDLKTSVETPADGSKKNYKRPLMARLSKRMFSKRKSKKSTKRFDI